MIPQSRLDIIEKEKQTVLAKEKRGTQMIPLSRPDITDRDKQAVMAVLDSNHLCLGPKLKEFEEKMAAYAGTKYAIACNSGKSVV